MNDFGYEINLKGSLTKLKFQQPVVKIEKVETLNLFEYNPIKDLLFMSDNQSLVVVGQNSIALLSSTMKLNGEINVK